MITFRSLYTAAFIITGALESDLRAQEEPSIIHVSADGKGDYKTIQEAVDNAGAESIVRVGKGTWTEAVTVTRPLTLEGVGWDVSQLVSAQAEQAARPSSEVVEALERISRELDAESRAKLQQAFHKVYASSPVLVVRGAERVVIRNLSFLRSEPVREGGFAKGGCIEVVDSTVEMENCAILESPGIGLTAKGDSRVRVKKCLIANSWGTGVKVSLSENGSFEIADSDIRNNVYSGISLGGPSQSLSVQRCRIEGTGWHGIRYDDCSPTIENNLFQNTAVSGIYASGRTSAIVRNNLFYHSGISCWFQNADTIENNTFIGDRDADRKSGLTQGLEVLGASRPIIRRNILMSCEIAVFMGDIGSQDPFSKSTGEITLTANAFWNNERNLGRHDAEKQEPQDLPLPEGNLQQKPDFANAGNRNFKLDEESALAKAEIGAQDLLSLESPWPLQPEEERSIRAVKKRMKQTIGQR